MDYEKKYKEALGWMQSLYKWLEGTTKEDAEHYFPELKESEDEKIRRHLIRHFRNKAKAEWNGMPIKDIITWLKKQGEQMSEHSYCQEHCRGYRESGGKCYFGFNCASKREAGQKQVPDWKPIDAEYMDKLYEIIDEYDAETTTKCCWKRWLKSLRPQKQWKPTEEQMRALNAINVIGGISYAGQGQKLINLYNDLKKLKED